MGNLNPTLRTEVISFDPGTKELVLEVSPVIEYYADFLRINDKKFKKEKWPLSPGIGALHVDASSLFSDDTSFGFLLSNPGTNTLTFSFCRLPENGIDVCTKERTIAATLEYSAEELKELFSCAIDGDLVPSGEERWTHNAKEVTSHAGSASCDDRKWSRCNGETKKMSDVTAGYWYLDCTPKFCEGMNDFHDDGISYDVSALDHGEKENVTGIKTFTAGGID